MARSLRSTRNLTVVAVLAIALVGCTGTPTASSGTPSVSGASAAAAFTPPDLTGKSFTLASESSPNIPDTQQYLIVKILKSWGADAKLVNLGSAAGGSTVEVVLSGHADAGKDPLSTIVAGGLIAFSPGQPREEYIMVGSKALNDIHDLPGHAVGYTDPHGLESVMLAGVEAHYNIDPASVTRRITGGGTSARIAQLVAGQIDATLIHYSQWLTLQPQGYHLLSTVATDVPDLADGFIQATSQWLTAHPDMAVAVNEAWLVAAKEFQSDEAAWVADAQAYTGNAQSDDVVRQSWQAYHTENLWPYDRTAFSNDEMTTNLNLDTQVGALPTPAPSLSQVGTTTYWDQAVKAVFP